jgi:hypothetical protein
MEPESTGLGDLSGDPGDPLGDPPDDADDWSDEQWLAWLRSTDGESGGAGKAAHTHMSRSRAVGALGNAMVGMYNAMYGRREDEIVIVVDGSGDPPDDDHPTVRLDPEHPERSEVIVRPRRDDNGET